MTRRGKARELAPDLLSRIRITAALLDERERQASRAVKSAERNKRALAIHAECGDSKLRLKIWRQLKMTTALLAARVFAEEMQFAGVAKYFRIMAQLKQAELNALHTEKPE